LKQECSMDEIARSLDVPVATVKSRLHRARKQLNLKSGFKVKERRSG
jgi:DNA-directed RNA polymerase specialized sigma24 family protein